MTAAARHSRLDAMEPTPANPTVWPSLACRDAKAMIEFLVDALGFELVHVYEDAGLVVLAQMRWGTCGGLMLRDSYPPDVGSLSAEARKLRDASPTGPVTIYLVCDEDEI